MRTYPRGTGAGPVCGNSQLLQDPVVCQASGCSVREWQVDLSRRERVWRGSDPFLLKTAGGEVGQDCDMQKALAEKIYFYGYSLTIELCR